MRRRQQRGRQQRHNAERLARDRAESDAEAAAAKKRKPGLFSWLQA